MRTITVVGIILCLLQSSAEARTKQVVRDYNQIADAIYKAEGGLKAKKPFGILSVPCEGYEECRQICLNTIRNNHIRWIRDGRPKEYLEYLRDRYCPINADNDPKGLNKNWLKNVKKFLGV